MLLCCCAAVCGGSKPKGRGSIPGSAASSFTLVSESKKPIRYNEKNVAVQQLARWWDG